MIFHTKYNKFLIFAILFLALNSFAYHKVEACASAYAPSISNPGDTWADDRCSYSIPSPGYFSAATASWSESGGAQGEGYSVLCVLAPTGTAGGSRCVVRDYYNQGSASGGIDVSCGSTACDTWEITVSALKTSLLSANASATFVPTASAPITGAVQVSSNLSSSATISGPANYGYSGTSQVFWSAPAGNYSIGNIANIACNSYNVSTPEGTNISTNGQAIFFNINYFDNGSCAPAPIASLTASPTTVNYNGASTLTWSSSNATSCTASGNWSGSKVVTGSSESTGALTAGKTYTLTCTGPGGSVVKTASVAIAAPTVTLSVSPSSVGYNTPATLNWSSTNATSCTASGDWSGAKTVPGSSQSTGNLTSAKSYTLTCTGPGGSGSDAKTVVVAVTGAPAVDLKANNSNGPVVVTSGSIVALSWTSANVTSCVASGDWSGSKGLNSSENTGSLSSNKLYTMTCSNAAGSAADTVNVNIGLPPPPPPPPPPSPPPGGEPAVTLTVTSPVQSGTPSNVSWNSVNASGCTISPSLPAPFAGTPTSYSGPSNNLSSNTTFTVTCTASNVNTIRSFTTSSSFTPATGVTSVDYLVVAGGGAGGSWGGAWSGGGGGGGGFRTGLGLAVTAGSAYTLTVGGGGSPVGDSNGTNGVNSSMVGPGVNFSAIGGGGGSGGDGPGVGGGSGGGGIAFNGEYPGGAGTAGQGNAGGTGGGYSNNIYAGGGGGGAGGAGGYGSRDARTGGNGGVGSMSCLKGFCDNYAGGGGGGITYNDVGPPGSGGAGGGGAGSSNGGWGANGFASYGGGGGGGAFGGYGGSGIIILKYRTPSATAQGIVSVTQPPTYTLTPSSPTVPVTKGSNPVSVPVTITNTLTSGTAQPISLSLSSLPSGVSYSISNGSCSPTCSSVITFTVAPNAPIGTFPVTVTGSPLPASGSGTTNFNLVISGNPSTVAVVPSVSSAVLGQTVVWTATVTGGTGPFTYSWSGTNVPATLPSPSNTLSVVYSTIGTKNITVTVTDADGQVVSGSGSVQVVFNPTFEEF